MALISLQEDTTNQSQTSSTLLFGKDQVRMLNHIKVHDICNITSPHQDLEANDCREKPLYPFQKQTNNQAHHDQKEINKVVLASCLQDKTTLLQDAFKSLHNEHIFINQIGQNSTHSIVLNSNKTISLQNQNKSLRLYDYRWSPLFHHILSKNNFLQKKEHLFSVQKKVPYLTIRQLESHENEIFTNVHKVDEQRILCQSGVEKEDEDRLIKIIGLFDLNKGGESWGWRVGNWDCMGKQILVYNRQSVIGGVYSRQSNYVMINMYDFRLKGPVCCLFNQQNSPSIATLSTQYAHGLAMQANMNISFLNQSHFSILVQLHFQGHSLTLPCMMDVRKPNILMGIMPGWGELLHHVKEIKSKDDILIIIEREYKSFSLQSTKFSQCKLIS